MPALPLTPGLQPHDHHNQLMPSIPPTAVEGAGPDGEGGLSARLPTPFEFLQLHTDHLQNPPRVTLMTWRCRNASAS